MLHIERPKGNNIRDERVELTIRDENNLRSATIVIATGSGASDDVVRVDVITIPGDTHLAVETRVTQR